MTTNNAIALLAEKFKQEANRAIQNATFRRRDYFQFVEQGDLDYAEGAEWEYFEALAIADAYLTLIETTEK